MCALLEERLGDNKFVTGDSLTTADLFWYYEFGFFNIFFLREI